MTTTGSNKFLLLVGFDGWLEETLKTGCYHLLSFDKSELSHITVEKVSQKVLGLLEAIEQKTLSRMYEDPSRRAECQMRDLELEHWLHEVSRPKKLWMQWEGNRNVCLDDLIDDVSFRTWWEYWQRFESTELCLKVVTNWGGDY